jgi:Tol biopolymer transport system component
MSLAPGTRLGPYEVTAALGSGGMGEVYCATDVNLKRQVALKVLPDRLLSDGERLVRLLREAEVLAALNHPNIAQIFGLEKSDGRTALVMELVDGVTLAEVIARGHPEGERVSARSRDKDGSVAPRGGGAPRALSIDDALAIARQIAEALDAAHERGIIHRDLKPGNIKVRDDGTVKVLDFGLAKAMEPVGTTGELANLPTLTSPAMTAMGVILGTAAYMAPEQARGRPVDRRADIWAFGVVLYEMLTGRRLFGGETVSDTLAQVLTRDPDWAALPPSTPPRLAALLRRCLERDPRRRQRDAGDLRLELDEITAGALPALAQPAPKPARTLARAAMLLFAGAAAGVAGWVALATTPSPAGELARLSVALPPSLRVSAFDLTPDGKTIVASARQVAPDGTVPATGRLYRRRIDDYAFTAIAGTDRVTATALSPDGRSVAFVATLSDQSSQRRISKVPLDGSSPPVVLADWDEAWGSYSWPEDGNLFVVSLATDGTALIRLPANGSGPAPPMKIATAGIAGFPTLGRRLPGRRGVFFTMEAWAERGYQLDQWLLDLDTAKATRLLTSAGNATFIPTGHIVFTRNDTLMAAPFDARTMNVGAITALGGGVRTSASWAHGDFRLSENGTLLYAPGGQVGIDRQLVVVDGAGAVTPYSSEKRDFSGPPAVSRDGRRAAIVIPNTRGTFEVWLADLDRPGLRRMLAEPTADNAQPVWSPDGRQIAYRRLARDRDDGLYVRATDGGEPRAILRAGDALNVFLADFTWIADGSAFVVARVTPGGGSELLHVAAPNGAEAAAPRVLRKTPAFIDSVAASRDGRLIAYTSDESGRPEIYVTPLGPGHSLGPSVRVSASGGSRAIWAGDSRRLFYLEPPEAVMAVTIDARAGLSSSAPTRAYDLRTLRIGTSQWSVLPDGRLLAIRKGEDEDDVRVLNVVINWSEQLRRLLPAD